jgi:iron only hydrogenase large subunit-like protein
VSSCASIKQSHSSDVVLTTTEFYQWMLRACVSRFTLRHVWEKTSPESADVIPELSEINPGNDFSHALEDILEMKVQKLNGITEAKSFLSEQGVAYVNVCPGGCANGGGQFRNL